MIDWSSRAAALADELATRGALTDAGWRDVFAAVPRHAFVPRFWQLDDENRVTTSVDGTVPADYATWADAIYRDQVLVTMHVDGTPTSSSSAPSAIALMLEALAPAAGDRVLEIGTGTGYNAALLCRRVGDQAVTSIDIDPDLVRLAGARLGALGYHPLLVAGDGFAGVPHPTPGRPASGPPYDRIVGTCATTGIPPAWVAQLAPGGRIVAPMTFGGALPVLTKTDPYTASGFLHPQAFGFMPLHDAGVAAPDGFVVPVPDVPADPTATVATELGEAALCDTNFALWLRLEMPASRVEWLRDSSGARVGVSIHTTNRLATVTFAGDGGGHVTQGGDRLFDELAGAWQRWQSIGAPARERFGMTATVNGRQHVWLDLPDGVIRWAVPR